MLACSESRKPLDHFLRLPVYCPNQLCWGSAAHDWTLCLMRPYMKPA